MPSASEVYQSYFKADDFRADSKVLTISKAEPVELEDRDGKSETKLEVVFLEDRRRARLNKTNNSTMVALFGDDYSRWLGNKIELFFDPTARGFAGARGGLALRKPTK
jgi:hypothetical protein